MRRFQPWFCLAPGRIASVPVTRTTFASTLARALVDVREIYPGADVERVGEYWKVIIPATYHVGHEAHFAQVTDNFLHYLAAGKLPKWEMPNLLAKYYTTTEAYRLSR